MTTSHTCLFTGVELDSTTKVEHTIPESLGGRIKSQIVSSSDFNHVCGINLDPILKAVYEPILNHLAPLLPNASQPGKMPISALGEPDGLYVERGEVSSSKPLLLSKDDAGKPLSVMAESVSALSKVARSMGLDPSDMKFEQRAPTEATFFKKRVPTIQPLLEIAALKSALLTFDHCLEGHPNRFTRNAELEPTRLLVREAAVTGKADSIALQRLSLGLQYEKMDLFKSLRRQIDLEERQFEHQLFVSGNPACRCLDMVWVILGFDPFGFRLSRNWQGEAFCYAVLNPIVKSEAFSGPHDLIAPIDLLCAPTFRCSIQSTDNTALIEQGVTQIAERRGKAYCDAVEAVEMLDDHCLADRFLEAAMLDSPTSRSVQQQIRKRLVGLYGRTGKTDEFTKKLDSVLSARFTSIPGSLLDATISDDTGASLVWAPVLQLYRECLTDLRTSFGPPGDCFTDPMELAVDSESGRLMNSNG